MTPKSELDGVRDWLDRHEQSDAERHEAVTAAVGSLTTAVVKVETTVEEMRKSVAEILAEHRLTLFGDGSDESKPGLRVRMDRVEQRWKVALWLGGVLWAAALGLAGLGLANRDLFVRPAATPEATVGADAAEGGVHGSFRP